MLKTQWIKEEKKKGASSENSSVEISLSTSASLSNSDNIAHEESSDSGNVNQADSTDSHQSFRSFSSSESSSLRLQKKSATKKKGKEIHKDSDSDSKKKMLN